MKIKRGLISINDIILCLLFVAATNFANKYFYIVFLAFAVYLLFIQRVAFNFDVICLFFLSFSIIFFAPWARDTVLSMIKPLVYPICYIMGIGVCSRKCYDCDIAVKEKHVEKVFVVIALGMFVHYLLNWVSNFDADQRNTVDFWTHKELAATNQAVMAVMILGVAIALLFSKVSVLKKIIAVGIIAGIMTYNLILAGRTLVALFLVVIFLAVIYRLSSIKRGRIKFIVVLLSVLTIIAICWFSNLFQVRTTIEESLLYDRFIGVDSMEMTEDGRLENKIQYLKLVWNHPFGGSNVREQVGYSHDIFFDTFDEAGVFAFLALTIYIISAIIRLIKCLKDKKISYNTKQLLLCVYSSTLIMFWLEPILQNASWFFAGFCVMDGCVSGLRCANRSLSACVERKIDG